MKPLGPTRLAVADALASAFLAGEWEPAAMGRRGERSLADQRPWITELARIVRAAWPRKPADQPRAVAELIAHTEVLAAAFFEDPDRPLVVHRWIAAPTAMGPARWPVPRLDDVAALATWLGVRLEHLSWFADRQSRERTVGDERLRHYTRSWLTKPNGSARLLEAPKRELKDLQRQILHHVLDEIPLHDAVHGFRRGRSAHSGAAHHRQQAVVLRLDLESFFTSVHAGRVYGLFRSMGYPEPVAHSLTGLCTTVTPTRVLRVAPPGPDRLLDPRRRMLQLLRAPHLPQGSPTSPALANLVAHHLDLRMSGLAATLDATYTRYADDLTLSGPRTLLRRAPAVIRLAKTIARDEGFRVNDAKTHILTSGQRQTVTGLVVNRATNSPRTDYDRLRAVLHDAARSGPDAANRAGHPDFRDHLLGHIAWIGATNPTRKRKLTEAFDAIVW